MNKVIMMGRLSKDVDVRYTQGGKAVASFSLAISEGYGDNKKTGFYNVVAWDKLAEVCGNNLAKGSQIVLEGRLQNRSYETQDGQKRYVTDIVAQNIEFCGSKVKSESSQESFGEEIAEEEIPF